MYVHLHQAVSSEIEQQRPKLEDLRGLGRMLSEGGAAKLVEPRLLPVNKRWAELDVNFTQVRNKSVSVLLVVKKSIDVGALISFVMYLF